MGRKRIRPLQTTPFSERLLALRKQIKLNRQEFSERVGVSKTYIGLLESGERKPSRDVVFKLAHALFPEGDQQILDELLVLAGFIPENTEHISQRLDLISLHEKNCQENPQDFQAYMFLVLALIKAGEYRRAQDKIQKGFDLFDEPVFLKSLFSNLELTRNNYQSAIENLELALEQLDESFSIQLKASMLFNLGEVYFFRGFEFLAQKIQAEHNHKEEQSQTYELKAKSDFQRARTYFVNALDLTPQDIYILDEYARVNFNLAFLENTDDAWQITIQAYRQVIGAQNCHQLGPQVLQEATAYLAHAFSKSYQFQEARLTLDLVLALNPDFWLIHYISACYFSLFYEVEKDTELLDYSLNSLKQAIQSKSAHNYARDEAQNDPDLSVLREKKSQQFNQLIKEGVTHEN